MLLGTLNLLCNTQAGKRKTPRLVSDMIITYLNAEGGGILSIT